MHRLKHAHSVPKHKIALICVYTSAHIWYTYIQSHIHMFTCTWSQVYAHVHTCYHTNRDSHVLQFSSALTRGDVRIMLWRIKLAIFTHVNYYFCPWNTVNCSYNIYFSRFYVLKVGFWQTLVWVLFPNRPSAPIPEFTLNRIPLFSWHCRKWSFSSILCWWRI